MTAVARQVAYVRAVLTDQLGLDGYDVQVIDLGAASDLAKNEMALSRPALVRLSPPPHIEVSQQLCGDPHVLVTLLGLDSG